MFTKEHIIAEIRRTAAENGGKPLGTERFCSETGIKESDWRGKLWVKWGDALQEAGFQPNQLQGPRSDEDVLASLSTLARELGHFPNAVEIKLKARNNPGFPWHNTFTRFGNKRSLVVRLRDYCRDRSEKDVEAICEAVLNISDEVIPAQSNRSSKLGQPEIGFVYLMKSGRYYKVGRTNAVGRRERELAIQLPETSKVIHSIKTDDPAGIEEYWHRRFSDRRKNGEWFDLRADDVAAFKRRKFM